MITAPLFVLVAQLAGGPWATALEALRSGRDAEARARLEALGADPSLAPEARAHAWSWAGQLAARRGALDLARRDFEAAARAAPRCFDARMATVHRGEVEMRAGRWREAERALAAVERDPDPVVATYAQARLRAVRGRLRRRALRYGSEAVVALAAASLAARVARALRRVGARAMLPRFGRAVLVCEAVALAGAAAVPRWYSSLAASGWMAFAIPSSVCVALLWATRAPGERARTTAWTALAALVALAAALHLALDLTWWSVEDPMP